MRFINLAVLVLLLLGLGTTTACLVSVEIQSSTLDSMTCPVLGPGIVITVFAALTAIALLAVGVMHFILDRSQRLWPSLYVINAALALIVPIGLVV